jgi:16S rRNA processing protein RimM
MTLPKNQSNQSSKKTSGSLEKSEPEFLEIGKVGKTHGLRGEVWMDIRTDFPERLIAGKVVYLGRDHKPKTIRSFQISGSRGLISFNGIDNPEKADIFKNQIIYIEAEHLPKLPEGVYYQHELMGMSVMDEKSGFIGKIVEIMQTGSNDVYVVADKDDETNEILIPAIKSVIIKVDVETKTLFVRLQEWI